MTIKEIKTIISSLALSQGSYWRLYRHLEEWNLWKEFKKEVDKAKCKDGLDIVLMLEC